MELLFVDICIFQTISGAEVYLVQISQKSFLSHEHDLALEKLAIFRYGRFEFEAVSDKWHWLHQTEEEEKEC